MADPDPELTDPDPELFNELFNDMHQLIEEDIGSEETYVCSIIIIRIEVDVILQTRVLFIDK